MDTLSAELGDLRRKVAQADGAEVAQRPGTPALERKRTAKLAETLPGGITISERRDGRAKPYYVRWGTDRKLESFALEQDRNDRAEALAKLHREEGQNFIETFSVEQWREWQAFRKRVPVPLAELEALWRRQGRKASTLTVAQAVANYMALRLAEDIRDGSDTHRHLKKHLVDRLCARVGAMSLQEVEAVHLRQLMDELTNPRTGAPMSDLTKRHHRKDWNTFFKRARAEGWRDGNPCELVKPPRLDDGPKPILSVDHAFAFFKANRDEKIVGRLALEAFGGLRCSSAERLREEHIKWERRGLELDKQQGDEEDTPHKSGKRKFRSGQPPVLWRWLKHAPETCWSGVSRKNYDYLKTQAFIRAHVPNEGNVLRHSFASYLLVVTKNLPLVGHLMQHTHTSTTEDYEGRVDSEEAGMMYLSITPAATALSLAQFKRSWRRFYEPPPVPAMGPTFSSQPAISKNQP